ncbi:MAG: ABC transporter ATP-binding protein [Hyphomicrobiales bacterium]|nr:ABC transporter ATP-binding protein [Hyphomicrobiales bacterium]MBV9051444.1 ABC transporter ATP-binding protein [Hyphomicrobiales bacterium]
MTLVVQGLCTGYGRIPILNGVDFTVDEGEFVGILGHNGMGKTTLLKALMGYLPATGGRVHFAGDDITALEPHRRARLGLGYVPQGREIFPGLTVHDNLRMGCIERRDAGEDEIIAKVLEEFPRLKPLLNRVGSALSGGEQQLLAVARCLCGGPRLVLLDEPTEGIQPSIIEEIVETLSRLRVANRRLTMILVEQNLDFIAQLSQRILVIQKGRITQEVRPDALRDANLIGEFVGIAT